MPLLLKVATGKTRQSQDAADVYQQLAIKLLRALELFDINRGWRFSTYLVGSLFRESTRLAYVRVRDGQRFKVMSAFDVECDAPGRAGGGGVRSNRILDELATTEPVESPLEQFSDKERASLAAALAKLPERERYIVIQRQTRTLKDIGKEMGLTKERVRQIQQRAMWNVRRSMSGLTPVDEKRKRA